jgi:hypothetical protein
VLLAALPIALAMTSGGMPEPTKEMTLARIALFALGVALVWVRHKRV